MLSAIEKAIVDAGFVSARLDQTLPQGARLDELMLGEVARADCIIADITGASQSVVFEISSAMTMGKSVFFIRYEMARDRDPSFLGGYVVFQYSRSPEGMARLASHLQRALIAHQKGPQRFKRVSPISTQTPFFVDWNRLERADTENLVRELLAQLGFLRAEWIKDSMEIDMIAELPKKDPDGFEYRELWYVATGRHLPAEMLLDMGMDDPEFLVHRLFRREEKRMDREIGSTRTLLLILLNEKHDKFDSLRDEFEERLRRRGKHRSEGSIRVRIWDRNYLTSLIHQFPNLGYKYFSDEGRAASKYRKTPEELYRESVEKTDQLTVAKRQLEEEKSLRISAERDSVWKDISFSAAHKLGNPIFAIETNLDPLELRIKNQRQEEALEVMKGIRASIEKAKGIVDQFKSLARSQKMELGPTSIKPIIDESCDVLRDQGINFSIKCAEDIRVIADAEHLSECFDELIRNSLRWFDKAERKIEIEVTAPAPVLPASVDGKSKYALIRFQDNGPGIPVEEKKLIFNAFYTTHDHGTGLGLALVRRIIEGHRGDIMEVGQPGRGVDFELYLLLAGSDGQAPDKVLKRAGKRT